MARCLHLTDGAHDGCRLDPKLREQTSAFFHHAVGRRGVVTAQRDASRAENRLCRRNSTGPPGASPTRSPAAAAALTSPLTAPRRPDESPAHRPVEASLTNCRVFPRDRCIMVLRSGKRHMIRGAVSAHND